MKSTKVSIIIPVYNAETYLHECLDSVCNQTYKDLEIICVDDGSKDNSLAILQEYAAKDERFIVLSQANAGQAVARNAALDIATGTWVTGLDSDDYFVPDAIEKAIACEEDDVDIICFNAFMFPEDNPSDKVLRKYWRTLKKKPDVYTIAQTPSEFWGRLWRRSMLDEYDIRFPAGLQFEDLPFVRMASSVARNIACIPDGLYGYRERENSSFHKHLAKKGGRGVLDYLKIADMCMTFWRKINLAERIGSDNALMVELRIFKYITYYFSLLAGDAYLHEAWCGVRNLIDKYSLTSKLSKFSDLALYYHMPPYASTKLYDYIHHDAIISFKNDKEKKDILLLINEKKILKKYRRTQFLTSITWGKKRREYEDIKRQLSDLLERCNQLKKESSKFIKSKTL